MVFDEGVHGDPPVGGISGAYRCERPVDEYAVGPTRSSILPRFGGVAPGARVCTGGLPVHRDVPQAGTYGLSLQMRRAAISIAANVAEGFAKRTKPEKARYLNIAEGSVEESRYYVILAQDLGYGETQALATSLDEVSRLLNAYVRAILASRS